MYVVNRVDEFPVRHETCEHQCRNVVQVNDVAIRRGVGDCPGSMVKILEIVEDLSLDRPPLIFVQPPFLDTDRGLAVGINDHIDPRHLAILPPLRDKQFCPTIFLRRNWQKRRGNQSNSH